MTDAYRGEERTAWHRSSASMPSSSLNKHHIIRDFRHVNVNQVHNEQLSFGDRLADSIANGIGSWTFIIIQTVLMVLWFTLNSIAFFIHWDGYPFIFLNLAMSIEAAFSAPVIMMSQNRQAEKDRIKADQDYRINIKAEIEVNQTLERIERQEKLILNQEKMILELLEKIDRQEKRELELLEKIDILMKRTGRTK